MRVSHAVTAEDGLIWTDLFKLANRTFFSFKVQLFVFLFSGRWFREPEEDGRGRLLRRRVTLICAGYADGSVQCRMTVLRRGEVPSSVASPTGPSRVSHSPFAHSPGRTFLHPSSSGSLRRCLCAVPQHDIYAASETFSWLSTAQINPTSSRAMATVTTLWGFR